MPVIESAVLSGRGELRIRGITFPARFRFTHMPGEGYRHYIETTIFGLPLMKVQEEYLDGAGRLELPFGAVEGAKIDQGANLALWGEAIWFPSLFVTDERVRWEPVDAETAVLFVPCGEDEQQFVVRFDPDTGMVRLLESMRYKDSDSEVKTLWLNQAFLWRDIDGNTLPSIAAVTWFDEGGPWAIFRVEDVVYNADVEQYIRQKGP